MEKKIYYFLLIFIFLLGFFLRFYKLGEVPYGFYQDESAIGYNAFSLIETGRDEYGEKFPLYFKSFGDYKLPVYIYLTAGAIKTFGLSEFAVRFPSALFGSLTLIAFYFFTKTLTRNKNLALAAIALLAVNPWHLHYSRATFEVSISLFLFVLGGFLLHKAFTENKKGLFLVGVICFIVDIYTYNLTRILAPLLLVLFIAVYRKKVKNISKPEFVATVIVSILILLPFVNTLLQSGGVSSAKGTLIFSSSVVQAQLLEFRSYLIDQPPFFVKVFFNQLTSTLWYYLNSIAGYFSVQFFFISGSSHGNHGIGNIGQFYLFELPLMIIGIVRVVWEKKISSRLLLLWTALVILVASLTRESPHATRSFFLITPLIIFSAFGLLKLLSAIRMRFLFIIIAGIVSYNLVYYFSSYYVRFPILYAKAWRSEDKALALYLKENENKYDKIIFDKTAGFIYTSLLFFWGYSPSTFQNTMVRGPDDKEGFSEILSFGKFEFKEVDWSKDLKEGTLIITSIEDIPEEAVFKKVFSYPKRPVVLSRKGEIIQYPVEEFAYAVVEKK